VPQKVRKLLMGRAHFRAKLGLSTPCFSIVDTPFFARNLGVNIAAPNRVRLPIDDPFEGDPKPLALDAKGYLSYCGPFSVVSEHELIHHLKLCSFENWVGTDQHRYVQLDKNTLTLSTPPSLFHSQKGIGRLTWQRVLTL
jgi:hypothetical protein